ncbi:MAG: GTP-binding protein [bacterium]
MSNSILKLVVTGHVDHGKSTVTGRLLADTLSLPDGKLEAIRSYCERNAKPFEYAFLLDALKDERSQGITIDTARIFFKTPKRGYVILDTPGHIEFLRNMVTGAAHADAAVLVIDALEGLKENSFRHGYLLSFLGISQIAILVNKMDLVGYSREVFEEIKEKYSHFLNKLGVNSSTFIPVSAMKGDLISKKTENMEWYKGITLLEMLDSFTSQSERDSAPFRMPVQDIYRFTKDDDNRRIVAGTVATGFLDSGDEVVFYPSGKCSFVKTIESFPQTNLHSIKSGEAAGFTLTEQIYINRGEIAVKAKEKLPKVAERFKAHLFWLGKNSLKKEKNYLLKIGTAKTEFFVEEIVRKIDAVTLNDLKSQGEIEKNEVAECIIKTLKPVAFDLASENDLTSRFVIVDDFDIRGGGRIIEADEDLLCPHHQAVMVRNTKWAAGLIDRETRAERHGHKPHLLIVTGLKDTGKKALSRELERLLFSEGRLAFFLGIANLLYGIDADLERTPLTRAEHIRRLSEVANIMLEAGHILIVTAIEITSDDLNLITKSVPIDEITTIWIGEKKIGDVETDIHIKKSENSCLEANKIKELLVLKKILF